MSLADGRNCTFLYSPDIRINYQVHGQGGLPIVFIHGFAAALTTWDDLWPLFPPADFTLYLLDLKGFGLSTKPGSGSYSIHEQAAIVAAFIDHLDLQDVALAGHSLGGAVALVTLLDHWKTERTKPVSRLILIDCAAYPQDLPRFMKLLSRPVLSRLLLALCPARLMVRYMLEKIYYSPATITPERIDRYARYFSGRGIARALIRTVSELPTTGDDRITGRFDEITLPTLILWGEHDRIIRCQQGHRLHGEISGSRLIVLKQCGHNPHEEFPETTCAVISQFIADTPNPD